MNLGTRSITLLWLFLATCTRICEASLPGDTNAVGSARDYPTKPVLIVEPLGVGLGPDLLARALAPKLSELWGQPVTVENHSGTGATAGAALVAKSPADGYTLLINTERHAYSSALTKKLPYDPLKDFIATASLARQPYVLVSGKSAGVSTVGTLIAAAKAKPGKLRFGSTGVGTGTHLCAVKFNFEAGIKAADVPPKAGDVIADVLAGTIEGRTAYMFAPISSALSQIRDGKLLPLGVSTTRRSPLLPEVPTIAEAGVAGFDSPLWYGIWVPAGTPPGVVDKLAKDIARVLAEPDMRGWLAKHGAEAMNMTQPEFERFVLRESESAVRFIRSGDPQ